MPDELLLLPPPRAAAARTTSPVAASLFCSSHFSTPFSASHCRFSAPLNESTCSPSTPLIQSLTNVFRSERSHSNSSSNCTRTALHVSSANPLPPVPCAAYTIRRIAAHINASSHRLSCMSTPPSSSAFVSLSLARSSSATVLALSSSLSLASFLRRLVLRFLPSKSLCRDSAVIP